MSPRPPTGRWLALGAVDERFWAPTRAVLATIEPAFADTRFPGLGNQLRHGDELHALLHRTFATRDRTPGSCCSPEPTHRSAWSTCSPRWPRTATWVRALDGERHVVFPVRRDGEAMGQLRNSAPTWKGV
ncbi:hypothetical protein [Saccharomonospora marina]|uniref:hypothetical protein n=1 Tax=Saccharomonospora marina TaxID=632569 RepID=UPI0002D72ED1|nr:hypothetical protein [Saccharomonospora marina]